VKTPAPRLAGGPALGRREEVLERHVQERAARLGKELARVRVAELGVDVKAPPPAAGEPRDEREAVVDGHGPPVADENTGGDGREPVPRREEAARLVERGGDQTAMDDPRSRLVPRTEAERGLVALDALLRRVWKVDSLRVVAAAPAERVVVRGDARYRSPPRSKCAR
jgi:hypothetical protein